ncbi:MAG: C45 family autoproteolytic acyltransferase/hydrolase [Syntrophales bacterium]|nr:C45 family autoproteolytic acyltransferase/hydrolase [Syntrophales bacterium]
MTAPLPLRTLELSGSPRELGRWHGQALGPEIRALRRSLLHYLARISLYGGALPLYALAVFLGKRFWPFIPPRFQEEMRGVAGGAQVGLGTILLLNVIDDLANNSPRCSALAAGGPYTRDGSYLLGRNLDYPLFTREMVQHLTLFLLAPAQGLPLASLAWPGYVGVCTGMNRAGVALAQLTSMSRDRTWRGVPAALRFRQALEEGADVPTAASLVLKAPGTIGNNLLLCAPAEAAGLEIAARQGVIRYPRGGLILATNHYQSGLMAPIKGRFPPRPPFSPLAAHHFTEAYSQARLARLQDLTRGTPLWPGKIQKILADSGIANAGTVVSVVFSPSEAKLWVARGPQPPVSHGPFQEIRLWD